MPSSVVEELSRSVRAALAVNEVGAGPNKQAFEIAGMSPSQFTELLRADLARWEPIGQESGFTPEN